MSIDMQRVRITNAGTCLNKNRNPLIPGTVVKVVESRREPKTGVEGRYTDGEIPVDLAQRWIKCGAAEIVGAEAISDPIKLGSAQDIMKPTNDQVAPLPSENAVSETGSNPTKPITVTAQSPWSIDPDGLRGMLVAELNAMIADRLDDNARPEFKPYETAEEAIAHLSRDFKGPASDEAEGQAINA